MSNINMSGANSSKSFTCGATKLQSKPFIFLYDEVMSKLDLLLTIDDETIFKIELNKIKKLATELINDHFYPCIFSLKKLKNYEPIMVEKEKKITSIKNEFWEK